MKTPIRAAVTALVVGVFTLLFNVQARPQAKVSVGENSRVSSAQLKLPLVEPQLVVNPGNPDHLLAVAMLGPFTEESDCVSFVSFDGGKSWAQSDFKIPSCADPAVVLREDGVALFSGITQPGGRLHIERSEDGGRTWAAVPVDFGGNHDHETLVLDRSSGPKKGSIYLVSNTSSRTGDGRLLWSVFVATSSDGGRSFTPPTRFVPFNLNFNTLDPVVLSEGTLVVTYKDFQSNITNFRSRDGQLERKRAWAITSADGGSSYSAPQFISESCGLGFGFLAADASESETRDRIYFACHTADIDGILVHHSSDAGNRWSEPIRADGGEGEVIFRQTPSIAVNKDGILGVTWYERREVGGKKCQYLYFAASVDGGKSFRPQQRVSSEASCPDTEQNGRVAYRWPAGGDYSGLAVDSKGVFHALWADSRDGLYRLWTAKISVEKEKNGR